MQFGLKYRIITRDIIIKILSFILLGAIVIVFFQDSIKKISQRDFKERLRNLIYDFHSQKENVDSVTEATDSDDVTAAIIDDIRDKYKQAELKPYIIDIYGKIILDYDEDSLANYNVNEKIIDAVLKDHKDFFIYKNKGKNYWIFLTYFEEWKWITFFIYDSKGMVQLFLRFSLYLSLFVIVILIISTIITILSLNYEFKPMAYLVNKINEISRDKLDLTQVLEVKHNDEIGLLTKSCNSFIGSLRKVITNIKETELKMSEIFCRHNANIENIFISIKSITNHITQFNSLGIMEHEKLVQTVSDNINVILSDLLILRDNADDQSSCVIETSSSINEIIATIEHITQSIEKNDQAVNDLVKSADEGRNELSQIKNEISDISVKSQFLLETNTIIKEISDQTNILAINASIESAHADKAGAGFSVVADEIRTLAEKVDSESVEIANTLKAVQDVVEKSVNTSMSVENSFNSVREFIKSVSNLSAEIKNAMIEQNHGGKQILETIKHLNNITTTISSHVQSMNKKNQESQDQLGKMINSSESMKENLSGILGNLKNIDTLINDSHGMSEQNKKVIENMVMLTDEFLIK